MDDFQEGGERALRALLQKAADGDTNAFEQFYGQTADSGLALARKLVPEREVEDFVARLYTAAWANLATYDPHALVPLQWLGWLARRVAGRLD